MVKMTRAEAIKEIVRLKHEGGSEEEGRRLFQKFKISTTVLEIAEQKYLHEKECR